MAAKIMSAEEAAGLVRDGDTFTISGVMGWMHPAAIIRALEIRFLSEGHPHGLTWFDPFPTGIPGLEPFAHDGFLRRVISGWYTPYPRLQEAILADAVEAYCYPLGTLSFLCQQAAAGRAGYATQVGLETYMDPRIGGARLNARTTHDLTSYQEINGEPYLWMETVPIDCAIIRGSAVDEDGNLSLADENLTMNVVNQALAAKAHGGRVLVQAREIRARGSIPTREVVVPGIWVDAIVIDPDQHADELNPELDWMDATAPMPRPPTEVLLSPEPSTWRAWALEGRIDEGAIAGRPLSADYLAARRAALDFRPQTIVNLGAGMPLRDIVPALVEEGVDQDCILTTEGGALGGVMSGGPIASYRSGLAAILDTPTTFSMYHGGVLETTYLGMLQFDAAGNVNLLRYGNTIVGPGGAMDIAVHAPRVVFCGTFRAGALRVEAEGGRLAILEEGALPRAVERVEAITFSGPRMFAEGKEVLYVTERAVFALGEDGPVLMEVAPGVDVEHDLLSQMGFRPRVAEPLRIMDARIFRQGRM